MHFYEYLFLRYLRFKNMNMVYLARNVSISPYMIKSNNHYSMAVFKKCMSKY